MSSFWHTIISFPTVVLTVPLALVVAYWGAVFSGLLDFGEGGGGDLDGALEGSLEGALEVADLDFDVDAGLEGALDGDAALDADGLFDGPLSVLRAPLGCIGSVLGTFGLVGVPLTMVLSLLLFFGWLLSFGGTRLLAKVGIGVAAVGGLTLLASLSVLGGAVFLGLALTSVAVRPLKPLFKIHTARSRQEWVGSVCTIRTGSVDKDFGQGEIDDGGAGLLLDVRCLEPNTLRRGSPALIYDHDAKRDVYLVNSRGAEIQRNLDSENRESI